MNKQLLQLINDWGFLAVSGVVTWVMAYSLVSLG